MGKQAEEQQKYGERVGPNSQIRISLFFSRLTLIIIFLIYLIIITYDRNIYAFLLLPIPFQSFCFVYYIE